MVLRRKAVTENDLRVTLALLESSLKIPVLMLCVCALFFLSFLYKRHIKGQFVIRTN